MRYSRLASFRPITTSISLLGFALAAACSSSTTATNSADAGTGGSAGMAGSGGSAGTGATGGTGGSAGTDGGAGTAGSGGTAGAAGADAGPQTVQVTGTVRFLQSGSLTLQNNGGDDLTVSQNGAFTFSTPVADGSNYAVTISANTSGQLCTVRNNSGTGTASAGTPTNVSIVCVVAESAKSSDTAGQTSTSDTYEDFKALSSLPVEIDGGKSKALVSLYVPELGFDATKQNIMGQDVLGIDVDGTVVANSVNGAAYWNQPAPAIVLAVVDLSNGSHTIKAVWHKVDGTAAATATSAPDTDTVNSSGSNLDQHSELTVTVLDSLDSYAGSVVQTGDASGTTTSTSFTATPLSAISPAPAVASPVLLTAEFPNAVNPTGTVFFNLSSGGTVVANSSYSGVRRGAAMMALQDNMSGATPVKAQWMVDTGTGTIANDPANLAATVFKAGANVMSTSVSGTASTTSNTYQDIPGVTGKLTLSAKRKVLYALQLDRAYTAGNGPQGEVSVFIDGTPTSSAYIQSQNSNFPHPVTIVGMVNLAAGNHTLTGRFKIFNGTQLLTGVDAKSITNLIAIPLE